MDQAASQDQGLLWYNRKCREDQIWIAISVYVLVAIVKHKLRLDQSLYTILQILSVTLFEKTPILQTLSSMHYKEQIPQISKQLNLFD